MIVSLNDFAATGDFGPVKAGCTTAFLETVFGDPEALGGTSRRYRRPTIWKYGDVEFSFSRADGKLKLIHIDHFNGPGGAPQGFGDLEVEPWIIREGLSREMFIAAVQARGLSCCSLGVEPGFEPHWTQETILLASGVQAGFVSEYDQAPTAAESAWDSRPWSPPPGIAWLSRSID